MRDKEERQTHCDPVNDSGEGGISSSLAQILSGAQPIG